MGVLNVKLLILISIPSHQIMYAGIFRWVLVALITCPYYLIVVYFYCIPRSQLFSVGQRPNKRSDDGRNEDGMMRLLAIGIC